MPSAPPAPHVMPTPAQVHLGVVVVNFASSHLLAENLVALDTSGVGSASVVVVDNWSSSTERSAIAELAQRHAWELVPTDANLGFGAGMNRGAARALERGCTHLLLLNPDVVLDAESLSRLVAFAAEQTRTIVSPRIDRPDGSTWFAHGRLDRRTGLTRSRREPRRGERDQWLSGACLVVDRDTWELLDGFDEDYFMYWEDIDLSQRLLEAGGELRVLQTVTAIHSVGGTQRGDGRSARFCFYMCRNRMRFAGTHLRRGERVRWLWLAPRYAWRAVLGGWRSILRHPDRALAVMAGTLLGATAIVRPNPSTTRV